MIRIMETLDHNARFVHSPNLISTDMEGERVLMSIDRGHYYGMKGVAVRAWELLEKPNTLSAVCAAICAEYDVEESTCRADLSAFASELLQHDLLRRC